jgi:hypothetical protein
VELVHDTVVKIAEIFQMSNGTAYFEFGMAYGPEDQPFVIKLVQPDKISLARRILAGEENEKVHVMGKIIKRPVEYNPGWSYHLEPESIQFFQVAIQVCDAPTRYVEDHLDEVGGAFLPGGFWCPWRSKLTREVVR